ncbi:uncharacterized protein LOC143244951 isoform X2 [Tachypleus tridentatus]|uniref:uncharacterized protein LOC143244951 isoform X2 n=1 Tax=Tachypleus tridentatus TaxID=6853 RepID=UPI003FD010EF
MNVASVTYVLLLVGVACKEVRVGKTYNCGDNATVTEDMIDFKIPVDTTCKITISPENQTLSILEEVLIFFESVSLGENDHFTLQDNSGNVLFGPFIGPQDPFMVLSGTLNLSIVVVAGPAGASAKDIRLHYSSKECSYDNHDKRTRIHYGELQSPIYSKRKKETTCLFSLKPQDPGNDILLIKFMKFHLSDSKLSVVGSEPNDLELSGTSLPSDIISKSALNMTLTLSSSQPEEQIAFILDTVSKGCSKNEIISNMPVTITTADLTGEKCLRIIHSEEKTVLGVSFEALEFRGTLEHLTILDGDRTLSSSVLMEIYSVTTMNIKERYIWSSGNSVMVSYLNPSIAFPSPLNFSIQIASHRQGGYFVNNGSIQSTSKEPVIFLLQVEEGEQVLLNASNSSFPPMSHVFIYSGFYRNSLLIADFKSENNVYPVISPSHQMMVISQNFAEFAKFTSSFQGIPKGCHSISLENTGGYSLSGNCNNTCSWAIPSMNNNSKDILSFDFSFLNLFAGDKIRLFKLDEQLTSLATVTAKTQYVPSFNIPANTGAYLSVTRGNCLKNDTALIARYEIIPVCEKEIMQAPGERTVVSSPNFPDSYPLGVECNWNIFTMGNKSNLHIITFSHFNVTQNHTLTISRVLKGPQTTVNTTLGEGSSSLPSDLLVLTPNHVEFYAPLTNLFAVGNGFQFSVTALDCGELYTDESGKIETPSDSNFCIWIIKVPPTSSDSVNIIIFSLTPDEFDENSILIYDGGSMRDQPFTNLSGSDIWSRTNELVILYHPTSYNREKITITYKTFACGPEMQCDNKICMHPEWVCDGFNNCGDYSDEKNCNKTCPTPRPTEHPETQTSGGHFIAIGLGVPAAFICGVCLTILVFKLKKRSTEVQYAPFPIAEE